MPASGRFSRHAAAALFLALGMTPAAGAAQTAGQAGAPTPLRIETPSTPPGAATGGAVESLAGLPEGRAVAILQNRIAALEEELRRLLGRVEEAEFRERQTVERIDRLVADVDRRLAALEQREAAAGGEAEADGQRQAAQAELPAVPEIAADPAARDGYVLGTIPRDALLGLPQPNTDGPAGTAPAAALQGTATSRFTAALELLQNGDFDAAEAAFTRWVADFPEDPQAPVASYWIGEAQLARGDHATAAATFAANYRTFGDAAPRAADNLLKLGAALAAMGDSSRACQTFAEMDRRYPGAATALRQALEREQRAAGCA